MSLYFDFFNSIFLNDTIAANVPIALIDAKDKLSNGNFDQFLTIWVNSTSLPSSEWKGMLVSEGSATPSSIPMQSALALWDPTNNISLIVDSGVSFWKKAIQNNTDAINLLLNTFQLQPAQLKMILSWLSGKFEPIWVQPYLIAKYGVENITDLAFLQWGQGLITSGVSVKTLYPEQNFSIEPGF